MDQSTQNYHHHHHQQQQQQHPLSRSTTSTSSRSKSNSKSIAKPSSSASPTDQQSFIQPNTNQSSIPQNISEASDQNLPNLPKVGELFATWDDFRFSARQAAEARGFSLSQSQSKGSSGTIVLRCSRFKEPGAVGQKMAENGCEVVFKVMKAKNGIEGFEVVQAFEEHNHPYGPDHPVRTRGGNSSTPGQPPKKKKKRASGPSTPSVNQHQQSIPPQNPAWQNHQVANDSMTIGNTSTPPAGGPPKPFLFDPYTGKPLRNSGTPVPTASTPSPPSHLDPLHYPPQVHAQQPAARQSSRHPSSRGSSSTANTNVIQPGQPQPYYSNQQINYSHPDQQQAGIQPHHIPIESIQSHQPQLVTPTVPRGTKRSTPSNNNNNNNNSVSTPSPSKVYPPLSIRLSVKAQNSINEFLTSLSPALTVYGVHFQWIGIKSPYDLLEMVEKSGEAELESFLDEIDVCGVGSKGEGVGEDEKVLIVRGLRKLRGMKTVKI